MILWFFPTYYGMYDYLNNTYELQYNAYDNMFPVIRSVFEYAIGTCVVLQVVFVSLIVKFR